MQTILGPVAERAARATGFVQRASKLSGARFVQTLVFGWLAQPQARLSHLVQTAATLGVPISEQGLDERFSQTSADCLREVLEDAVQVVLAAEPVAVPVLRRFPAVAVQDCTTITLPAALAAAWPGCGGSTPAAGAAAMKVSVRLDLASGRLEGPYVEAGRTNDHATTVASTPLPPGALRLADLGFFGLDDLAEQHAQGVFSSRAGNRGRPWPPRTASARNSSPCWRLPPRPCSISRCSWGPATASPSACSRYGCRRKLRTSGGGACVRAPATKGER